MRLVNHQIFVEKGAAAHEVERLDFDARANQVAGRRTAPFAGSIIGLVKHVEVVFKRAHPRIHFFFFGAGQKADVFTDRNGDARHNDFAIELGLKRLHQAGSEREQGLAGAGLAEQGDEIDIRIHQQIEREVLFAVARGDAPYVVARVAEILECLQDGGFAADFGYFGLKRLVVIEIDHLIHNQTAAQGAMHPVKRMAGLLP